jgi:uncharacterized membrane protein
MFGIPPHFLIVHFPLALLIAALFYDLRGEHDFAYRCTMWAALGSALAVLSGLILVGGQLAEISDHAGAGITGGIITVILAVMRYSRRARGEDSSPFPRAWLLVESLAVLGIVVAAITGHRAVLGY